MFPVLESECLLTGDVVKSDSIFSVLESECFVNCVDIFNLNFWNFLGIFWNFLELICGRCRRYF